MSFSDTTFDSFLSDLFALPLLLLLPRNPVGAVGAVGVGYCPCLGSRASHRGPQGSWGGGTSAVSHSLPEGRVSVMNGCFIFLRCFFCTG